MKNVTFNFEELRVYQLALKYVDSVYETTKSFPDVEKYRLTSQYIRASTSIALNIAEGAGDTNAQFNRFLQITHGSIKECVVCSTIARIQKYISKDEDTSARLSLSQIAKLITKLQKYLKEDS